MNADDYLDGFADIANILQGLDETKESEELWDRYFFSLLVVSRMLGVQVTIHGQIKPTSSV